MFRYSLLSLTAALVLGPVSSVMAQAPYSQYGQPAAPSTGAYSGGYQQPATPQGQYGNPAQGQQPYQAGPQYQPPQQNQPPQQYQPAQQYQSAQQYQPAQQYGGGPAYGSGQPAPAGGQQYLNTRVAELPAGAPAGQTQITPEQAAAVEHPLVPALRWANAGLDNIRQIQDYSATFVKRERIDGVLKDHEYMFVKVRHQPFSVYVYFLGPKELEGQEALYVSGRNEGKILAHSNGIRDKVVGTVSLAPDGWVAMRGNRYPLTDIGLLNLTERLLEVGESDTKYGECEVNFYQGTKVNGRSCTCIEVKHPVPRRNFRFHLARIYVDDELVVPTRYEAWDWPTQPGGPPQLTEEYTYLNLKLNNGFTDADFDAGNQQYSFR